MRPRRPAKSGAAALFRTTILGQTWCEATFCRHSGSFKGVPHWGPADGQNLWDKNLPNGSIGYWARGTHTGADGMTLLTDENPKKPGGMLMAVYKPDHGRLIDGMNQARVI